MLKGNNAFLYAVHVQPLLFKHCMKRWDRTGPNICAPPMCHVSRVTCHMSRVTCEEEKNMVELVGRGSTGPTLSSFNYQPKCFYSG